MRNLILFTLVVVVLMVGGIFYLDWEKKNFIESLPQSPTIVDQPVDNSFETDSPLPTVKEKIDEDEKTEITPSANETEDSNDSVQANGDVQHIPDSHAHEPQPRQRIHAQGKTTKENPNSEPSTPDEKADFVRDQWIEMFGDIPQVHVASEYIRKAYKNERMTIDEQIAGLEASHYLFPDGGHKQMLEMLKTMKADGIPLLHEDDLESIK
jgi:hypothetical protein